MENPFRYGEIVSGSFFTDREHELADIAFRVADKHARIQVSGGCFGRRHEGRRGSALRLALLHILEPAELEPSENEYGDQDEAAAASDL